MLRMVIVIRILLPFTGGVFGDITVTVRTTDQSTSSRGNTVLNDTWDYETGEAGIISFVVPEGTNETNFYFALFDDEVTEDAEVPYNIFVAVNFVCMRLELDMSCYYFFPNLIETHPNCYTRYDVKICVFPL